MKRQNSRGTLEVQAPKRANSLILLNDNDENRRQFENCTIKGKRVVNPIIDWTTEEILQYIESEHIVVNPLYSIGFHRVGCIGCPMCRPWLRKAEFAMFPKIRDAYIRAFDKMLEQRKATGKWSPGEKWGTTAADVYYWWIQEDMPKGQLIVPYDPPITEIPDMSWMDFHKKTTKKVRNVETGQVYDSGAIAARSIGVSRSAVVDGIRRHNGYCAGYHWEFVTEDNDDEF